MGCLAQWFQVMEKENWTHKGVWILIIIERSLFKNVTSVNCGEFSIVVYCCCHVYWKLLISTAHHCSKQNKFRIML